MEQRTARNKPASFSGTHVERQPSEPESFPRFLSLTPARPRPAAIEGLSPESLALPSDLALAVARFAGSEADKSPTLLAAFAVLLHRYSGGTQIVVGIPLGMAKGTSSGNRAESVAMTQPFYIDLSGDPEFRDFEASVRRQWREAATGQGPAFSGSLQDDPFGDIQGSAPQFQLLFSYSPAPSINAGSSHLPESGNRPGRALLGTELNLRVIDRGGELECALEYSAALFDKETVRRMLGHFQVLLRGVVANPDERISTLPLLTDAERRQLIEEWNPPAVAAPSSSEKFQHEAFAAQAAKTPDAIAVTFEKRHLTFRDLDVQSNQLAHLLRRHGVGPDILVGICLERSPELVVGVLAILKAGGAFVPLEPSYPDAQLSELLSETRPPVLITHSRLLARLPSEGRAVICLDTERDWLATESSAELDVRVTGENLAAVIFSSGSTGKPKAISRPHRAHRFNPSTRSTFQLCESDRHLLKTSLDSSLIFLEIFWPLLTGGRMIIAGPQENSDTAALLRLVVDHQITIIALVPSLLGRLVAEVGLEACTSLRHVICFGEPLSVDIEERLGDRLPTALGIFYGTSEAPALAFRQCRGSGPRPLGNLGYRLSNRQIFVLDARLQPVPIGVPGELVAGGPGLAVGYLNRHKQTEERFIPHPFSEDPGARLFRTGDRVRWRSDGSLEFMARFDDQVKIRGYRVEPAEVEAALMRHPGVLETAVVARQNRDGENQLVAYLVARSQRLTVSDLRAHLAQSLPAQLIPSIYVGLERLPRRPNGKMDRHALPSHELNRLESGQPYAAPRTSMQETLARAWGEVLGDERPSIHVSFFNLGGDSLLAIRLVSEIEKRCGQRVSLATLLAHPSIARLAEILETDQNPRSPSPIVEVRQGGSKPPLYFPPTMFDDAFNCEALLEYLPTDQPVYVMGGNPTTKPGARSMEAIAFSCCDELCAFQPDGPINLAGHSFSGMLAYEIARELTARGRQVKLLAIIDVGPCPILPRGPIDAFNACWLFLQNLPGWIGDVLLHLPEKGRLGRTLRSTRKLFKRLSIDLGHFHRYQPQFVADDVFDTNHWRDDLRARVTDNLRAMADFRCRPYPGRAVLFRARTRPLFKCGSHDLGWGKLVLGGLDIVHISGNHHSILRQPYVHALARELQAALDAAREDNLESIREIERAPYTQPVGR